MKDHFGASNNLRISISVRKFLQNQITFGNVQGENHSKFFICGRDPQLTNSILATSERVGTPIIDQLVADDIRIGFEFLCRTVDIFNVKTDQFGEAENFSVFSLRWKCTREDRLNRSQLEWNYAIDFPENDFGLVKYENSWNHFREKDFSQAKAEIVEFLKTNPNDREAIFLSKKIEEAQNLSN